MIEHHSPISSVAVCGTDEQGQLVVTGGYDNQVIVWAHQGRRPLARAFHDHLVNHVSVGRNGTEVLSSGSDHVVKRMGLPDLDCRAVLIGHHDDVEMARFSPSGDLIATASRDHLVRLYEVDGRLCAELSGHTSDVLDIEWIDERRFVTSGDDGRVLVWTVGVDQAVVALDLDDVETDTCAVSRAGTIWAGNDDGEFLTVRNGDIQVTQAHRVGVKRIVFDEPTGRLLTASYDGTTAIWRIGEGSLPVLERRLDLPWAVWPRAFAFAGAKEIVAGTYGSSYATLCLESATWDLGHIRATPGVNAVVARGDEIWTVGDSGVVRRNGRVVCKLGSLCNFVVSWGTRMVAGGQSGVLFDAETGEELDRHRAPLNCAVPVLRDGHADLAVGTYDGYLLVERGGSAVGRVAEARLHENAIKSLATDGKVIFSVCANAAAAWHRLSDLAPIAVRSRAHDRIANGAILLSDGRFASVGRDRTLRLWTGQAPEVISTPHRRSVKCVATAGDTVATAGYDGIVAVYDIDAKAWRHVVRPTASGVSSLATDGAGAYLASSYDGAVYRVHPGTGDVATALAVTAG